MKHRLLVWLMILCLLPVHFSAADSSTRPGPSPSEEPAVAGTDAWEPPVIDTEDALQHAPWLLVLKVAQEEIGYREETAHGWNKYSAWAGNNGYSEWCTEFVTWCAAQADERWGTALLDTVYPYATSSKRAVQWFTLRDRIIGARGTVPATGERMWLAGADHYMTQGEYIPQPGDILWVSWFGIANGTDHTTLVEGVTAEPDGSLLVHVIEGNNPDSVQRNTYPLNFRQVYGFGTPVRRANRQTRLWNRNGDALAVQAYLIGLGYLKGPEPRDQLDEKAVAAIKAYQRDHGLRASGMVDLETRALMAQDPEFLRLAEEMQK